jgi:hypothetical protein
MIKKRKHSSTSPTAFFIQILNNQNSLYLSSAFGSGLDLEKLSYLDSSEADL